MEIPMEKLNSLIGTRFTRLLVTGVVVVGKGKAKRLSCVCDCGGGVVTTLYKLNSGINKSCGCLARTSIGDRMRKHGMANSRLTGYVSRSYGIWQAMRDRCNNPNRADYHRYGGRGITVCERWQSFENFLEDMGEPPDKFTLERLEKDAGYFKENCIWADRKTQAANTSRNRTVTVDGVRRLAQHVAADNGIGIHTYRQRLYVYHWTLEEACGLHQRSEGSYADTYGEAK